MNRLYTGYNAIISILAFHWRHLLVLGQNLVGVFEPDNVGVRKHEVEAVLHDHVGDGHFAPHHGAPVVIAPLEVDYQAPHRV